MNKLFFLLSLFWVMGCVSGAKRLAQLDLAATHAPALENLCREGINGACAMLGKPVVMGAPLSILQGLTSADMARFTVVVPKKETYVYYARMPDKVQRLEVERVQRKSSPMAVDQVRAFGLAVGQTYELLVIDGEGMAADRRNFKALDVKKKTPRIAVASCQDDSLKTEQAAMWKQFIEDKPDLLLMIGDNVYADRIPGGWQLASAEQLWDRYSDTRAVVDFYKARDLIPVIATWDDHDYGRNDADRTYALKEESARVFQAFFAQTQPTGEFTRGPGVASALRAFGLKFVLLDDRSFRSPNQVALADETHFGAEQEEWLLGQLTSATEPVFVVSGDQFFGGYSPFESYEGSHPRSFAKQLARWRKTKPPIVFVSGDRHLTEIIQVAKSALGYPTFELTSSPMHAKVFADAFHKNPSPNQLVGVAGKYNYMLIEIKKSSPKMVQMNVRARGLDQATLYQRELTVKK